MKLSPTNREEGEAHQQPGPEDTGIAAIPDLPTADSAEARKKLERGWRSWSTVRRRTIATLLVTQAVLAGLHVHFTWALPGTYPPQTMAWFDLGYESNLPTGFAVLQLLLLAATFFAIAHVAARAHETRVRARAWSGIGLLTMFFAADEALELHEAAGDWLGDLMSRAAPDSFVGGLSGFGSYYWILIYGPVALPAALALAAFFYREIGSRWRVASLGLFLSLLGALGLDYIEGRYGTPNHERIPILLFGEFYRFDIFLVEETLEMIGVTLLIAALSAHAVTLHQRRA